MNSADERVWELLQTLDLENLDITTFQGVAAPIFAQKENKEALEALALIAFARMARQGEFNGWLNAGGSAAIAALPNTTTLTAPDTDTITLHQDVLFGQIYPYSPDNTNLSVLDNNKYWPFYVPRSGNVSEMSIYVSTADTLGCDVEVGIYETSGGLPTNLLGSATFDCASTGTKTQTSFTATITLTEGALYYLGASRTTGSSDGRLRATNSGYTRFLNVGTSVTSVGRTGFGENSATTSLPSVAVIQSDVSTQRIYCGLVIT